MSIVVDAIEQFDHVLFSLREIVMDGILRPEVRC